jgi:hypothetical protein
MAYLWVLHTVKPHEIACLVQAKQTKKRAIWTDHNSTYDVMMCSTQFRTVALPQKDILSTSAYLCKIHHLSELSQVPVSLFKNDA